jgi:hypothetical protein
MEKLSKRSARCIFVLETVHDSRLGCAVCQPVHDGRIHFRFYVQIHDPLTMGEGVDGRLMEKVSISPTVKERGSHARTG